jgi:GNAT superfamily N-acetyltransferase
VVESFHIRAARPEDHAHYLRLFAELGVDDEPVAAARWRERMAPDTLFLEERGEVRAYGYLQILEGEAYVRHVAVDPAARGRGLGRRMMLALAARARARSCGSWRLNVMRDNAVAIRLYESLGMRVSFPTSVVRLPWEAIGALRSSAAVSIERVTTEQRSQVERAFALPPGLLAAWLELPDHRVLRASTRGEASAGLAHFDPAYPGAWPFLARGVGVARALLDSLLAERPAGSPWIQLVIEDDRALTRDLIAAGAALIHDIVHMQGLVPRTASGL